MSHSHPDRRLDICGRCIASKRSRAPRSGNLVPQSRVNLELCGIRRRERCCGGIISQGDAAVDGYAEDYSI